MDSLDTQLIRQGEYHIGLVFKTERLENKPSHLKEYAVYTLGTARNPQYSDVPENPEIYYKKNPLKKFSSEAKQEFRLIEAIKNHHGNDQFEEEVYSGKVAHLENLLDIYIHNIPSIGGNITFIPSRKRKLRESKIKGRDEEE